MTTDNNAGIEQWLRLRDADPVEFDRRLDRMPPKSRDMVLDHMQMHLDLADMRQHPRPPALTLPDDRGPAPA